MKLPSLIRSRRNIIISALVLILVLLIAVGLFVPIRSETGFIDYCSFDCGFVVCDGFSFSGQGALPVEKSYRYNWLFGQLSLYRQQTKNFVTPAGGDCSGTVVRVSLYVL